MSEVTFILLFSFVILATLLCALAYWCGKSDGFEMGAWFGFLRGVVKSTLASHSAGRRAGYQIGYADASRRLERKRAANGRFLQK